MPSRLFFVVMLLLLSVSGLTAAEPNRGDLLLDAYFRHETKRIADACLSDIKTRADWEKQRPELRRQFLEMMGLWPLPPRTDLRPVVTGKIVTDQFIIEKLHFQSLPGLYVTGNLYIPKGTNFPAPAVLYVCGHANTVEEKISYGSKVNYQHHPAWFAENGYACLVLDTLQLGEIQGIHHGLHRFNMWWWMTLGYTPAGIECWNAMRALDYLETRKEVDPKRMGVTGRSGGGATSWWLAAADDRPQCIIPVAGISDLWSHVVEGVAPRLKKGVINGHCDCMYFVNTYRWDFGTVAALCAPRPLMLGNSDADDIFPVPGYRQVAEKARRIYDLHNAGDKFVLLETAGPHKDTVELRTGAFRWMNRWLKNDTGEVKDREGPRFPPAQLKVFERLPEDEINTRIHELLIKPALPDLPKSPEVARQWWTGKREEWMQALKDLVFRGWPNPPPDLNFHVEADVRSGGLWLRTCGFRSQEGVNLRLWLITGSDRPKQVTLITVDEAGWKEWLAQLEPVFAGALFSNSHVGGDISKLRAALASRGGALAIVAPRGIGPTRWSEADTPADIHIRRRFGLLGQTLDGQRIWDVRRAVQVLQQVEEMKNLPIRLEGRGVMAGVAVYAGIFEPTVTGLDLNNPSATHSDGPILLNVRKILDMPQSLALAFPRSVHVQVKDEEEARRWDWPVQLQRALGKDYLKIRVGKD